jgi:glycolate oxidase FAD binding subunit
MDDVPSATVTHLAAFAEAARIVVSNQFVRAAGASDAVAGVRPQTIVEPGDEQELAAVLKLANDEGLAVIPRGGGTKLGWGNPPKRADVVLSTARLNRVIEHAWADLTVTVEAGCTIQNLQDTLAQHGQRLALDPLWPQHATVGGVLATNDSGALRLRFGALRDLIIGVTLVLPDGTLAKSGGKVVKNVAGYDLPKLVTGAFGTLGVITRAVFRLHPVPKETSTISVATRKLREAQQVISTIQDSQLAHSALQLRCGTSIAPQVDVLFEATSAGLAAQVAQLKELLPATRITDCDAGVWRVRQDICDDAQRDGSSMMVAKISVLPADIGKMLEALENLAQECKKEIRYQAVVQATGIGCFALQGDLDEVISILYSFNPVVWRSGGSHVIQHRPREVRAVNTWGVASDAVALMHAVKHQFDPRSTLNPGRFVGDI